MLTYNRYARLRYVLLINILAALAPAMEVRGRANDPLLGASWWRADQHSAVPVVALAAILGTAVVFTATRRQFRRWGFFVGCGILVGIFPATFYRALAPQAAYVPLADMYVSGTVCGTIAGVALHYLLRPGRQAAGD